MRQHNDNSPKLRPLTTSSEFFSQLMGKLRMLFPIVILIALFESTLGHVAFRSSWEGVTSDPSTAYRCTVKTLPFLEEHSFNHYYPLICVVEPRLTIREYCFERIKGLLR